MPVFTSAALTTSYFVLLYPSCGRFCSGVAHSFTGSAEDRDRLLSFNNLFIGKRHYCSCAMSLICPARMIRIL